MKLLRLVLCVFACGLVCAGCAPEPGPTTPTTSRPQRYRMTPRDIRTSVSGIMSCARACGYRYRVPGRFRVRVVVSGATGSPVLVTVLNSPIHLPTERCLIDAFQSPRFPRFGDRTQRFIYPIVYR